MAFRIEGYVIVSADGMLANAAGLMPDELKIVMAVCALFNILFFLYPGPLVGAASAAARSLF